jgi:putative ABC transport system permease protein
LNSPIFHISLYDVFFLGTIFIGLTFALLLWFKSVHRSANRILAVALTVVLSEIARILAIDIQPGLYLSYLDWFPLTYPLLLGPFTYFYVLKIVRPEHQFRRKDLLHFTPWLLEISAAIRHAGIFKWWPVLLLCMAFIWATAYLIAAQRMIKRFQRRQQFTGGDRYRHGYRLLYRLLSGIGSLWLLCLLFKGACFFYQHQQLAASFYYPTYLLMAAVTIGLAAAAFLRPELKEPPSVPTILKSSVGAGLKQKGTWLKKMVQENRYYEDPELNLGSLAEKLDLGPHELSRIINTALKKSFVDFISEYRVAEVVRKMQEPAFDHITLLGIAYDSGFNSKSTFNRIFKDITGKSPIEFKTDQKKEFPTYNVGRRHLPAAVISYRKATPLWPDAKLNRSFMIKNYFKIAWRNLAKNKFYSALNITGLTVGLTIGMLILLWVNDELSFDGYHRQAKQIYRVNSALGTGLSKGVYEVTPGSIAAYSLRECPGVLDAVRYTSHNDYTVISYKDKDFTDNRMFYTEPSLFHIFDYPLLEGNVKDPFPNDHSVVITEATAKKYFGHSDAMGKILQGDHKENFVVSGVMKDVPENSALQCDILFSIEVLKKAVYGAGPGHSRWPSLDDDFGNYQWNTYLLLKPGTALKPITDRLFQVNVRHQPGQKLADIGAFQLQPLTQIHLYAPDGTSTAMQTVEIFSLVAFLILLIASINYVNLSTARAMLRAREVSVRKIIGAARRQLIAQFVIETLLFFAISLSFAMIAIALLMPFYDALAAKQLHFNVFSGSLWKVVSLTVLATLLAASIYPALLLSSFKPIDALKGKISPGMGNAAFRKVLVVGQFVFSIGLIIGTLVINRQLGFIRSKSLGYEKTNVFSLPMRGMQDHYTPVRTELLRQPGVLDITSASQSIINIQGATLDVDWDGKDPHASYFIHSAGIDENFFSFFKLMLAQGRGFSGAKTDTARLILNETAVREAGIQNPVGKRFRFGGINGTIAGVVRDFHFNSLKQKIKPFVFYYQPAGSQLFIKTTGANAPKAIKAAQAAWKTYNPGFPMNYAFMDDAYNQLYQSDQRTGLLFDLFAGVAILISCLGLFGLAAYTAQVRVKEIGIRKVLGASATDIAVLFSKDFLVLVAIAILIATPVSWYAMNQWLLNYAYRSTPQWWLFALAGSAALLIALLTISFQSLKAALANPVRSLRSE